MNSSSNSESNIKVINAAGSFYGNDVLYKKVQVIFTNFVSIHTELNIPPTFKEATLIDSICHSRRLIGILLSGGHRPSIAEFSHLRRPLLVFCILCH